MITMKYHQLTIDFLKTVSVLSKTHQNELNKKEQELGVKFPASFWEWYSLGNYFELLQSVDYQPNPKRIQEFELDMTDSQNPFLSFMWENQGCCYWGIPLNEQDDPAVYRRENDETGNRFLFADHFSTFIHLIFKRADETLAVRWPEECYPLTMRLAIRERNGHLIDPCG